MFCLVRLDQLFKIQHLLKGICRLLRIADLPSCGRRERETAGTLPTCFVRVFYSFPTARRSLGKLRIRREKLRKINFFLSFVFVIQNRPRLLRRRTSLRFVRGKFHLSCRIPHRCRLIPSYPRPQRLYPP